MTACWDTQASSDARAESLAGVRPTRDAALTDSHEAAAEGLVSAIHAGDLDAVRSPSPRTVADAES